MACPRDLITQLLHHVTSSPHVDVKGDIFRHTIYPPSLVVIAFTILGVRRGAESFPLPPPPDHRRLKKPGLNRVKLRSH